MDLCLYAKNNSIPVKNVADYLELTEIQIQKVFKDIDSKRKSTQYLHSKPILVLENDDTRMPYWSTDKDERN